MDWKLEINLVAQIKQELNELRARTIKADNGTHTKMYSIDSNTSVRVRFAEIDWGQWIIVDLECYQELKRLF